MKSLINSILLPLAVAMCLTLGACAERQPGQAQDHIGTPSATSHEQAEPTGEQTGTKPEDPKQENADTNTDKGNAGQKDADPTDAAASDDNATAQKANPIDSLRKELSAAQTSIEDLNTKVAQLKVETSDNYLYVIITFILAVIGVATAFVNFFSIRNDFKILSDNIKKQDTRLDRHRRDLTQLEQQSNNNSSISHATTDLQQLKQRVATLESQLLAAQRGAQPTTNVAPTPAPAPKQPSQHAFFPAPAMGTQGAYFPKQLSSRESALFEATIVGSKAEFRPCVSFQNIISIDALRNAIEFQGASKNEAKNMVITTSGQAELRNNKWCILRKITIYLTK